VVVAAKPTADFDAKVPATTAANADHFPGQLYQELKSARCSSFPPHPGLLPRGEKEQK